VLLPIQLTLLQLIPDDFEYSAVNGDAFVSTDATTQIKEGTEVRIKIVGVRADPLDMVRLGLVATGSSRASSTSQIKSNRIDRTMRLGAAEEQLD
jgi:hypothetical protein